jgi:tol-pal system protein YbgF
MLIRASSSPEFRFAQIRQGQQWLPIIALMLLPLQASAAPYAPPPLLASPRQAYHDAQDEDETGIRGLRDEQGKLAGRYWQSQEGFSVMLAQAHAAVDELAISGQKMAQAESGTSNRGVVQLLNQVEALNGELNRLRGQIEVLANDVNNAQKRQRDMYVDLDTRLRRIEQAGAANKKDQEVLSTLEERIRKLEQGPATTATIPQPVIGAAAPPPVVPPPPAVAAAPTTAAVPPSAAAANPGAAVTPSPSSSLPPASLSATDQVSIQRAYDSAYSNYRLGEYAGAIRGFESFLKSYPKHPLAANAQYWIGEAYARQGKFREAIEAEHRLLGTFPESAKSADALLIIGTAESSLGDTSAARKTFEELIDKHPGSDAADKAKGRLAKLK